MLPTLGMTSLPAMSKETVAKVNELEAMQAQCDQVPIQTQHLLHAGMYVRTIRIPAGAQITGALIKIPTVLTVHGDVIVFTGEEHPVLLSGYNVLPASAGRKQVFRAISEAYLTMQFPTNATSVEQAESEFTDEVDKLMSRRESEHDHILITGE